jgi:hypothetical protein
MYDLDFYIFIEVPCIDNAFRTNRLNDFFYEHFSHFSTDSFTHFAKTILKQGWELGYGYKNEVIYCIGKATRELENSSATHDSIRFGLKAENNIRKVREYVSTKAAEGKSILVWGGTGKAAAFFNLYSIPDNLNIRVVDSDSRKHGGFVPGKGYLIESPDAIHEAVDVIIIATQWRAADIAKEIHIRGISAKEIVVECDGDFLNISDLQ